MRGPEYTQLEQGLLDRLAIAADAFREIRALVNSPTNMARLKTKAVRDRIAAVTDRGLKLARFNDLMDADRQEHGRALRALADSIDPPRPWIVEPGV